MSRSNAPKQDTINKWCNSEAVTAWAERLDEWADQLSPMFEGERTTAFCTPNCDHEGDRQDAIALRAAANQLRAAASDAAKATNEAQRRAYDRLYNRTPAA